MLAKPAGHPDWRRGVELFNAGHWWEAHEAWEPLWLRSTGSERHLLQGVILLAAALHKRWHHGSLTHRNYHKAAAHFVQVSQGYAEAAYGLNLAVVQQQVWAALHDPALRPTLPWSDEAPRSGILEANGPVTSGPDVH
ncbi:DUF309 domain-containing protein [Deinococcus navajonensis]|uniref:DUF309 domain-containing protein n=1 Tax=Deinococcus navajonensis TaxID=309884 RepID=A0ABV8XJD8_9DEIO